MDHRLDHVHDAGLNSDTIMPPMHMAMPVPQYAQSSPAIHFGQHHIPQPLNSPISASGGPVFSNPTTPLGGFHIDFVHRQAQIPFHPLPGPALTAQHTPSPVSAMVVDQQQVMYDAPGGGHDGFPSIDLSVGGMMPQNQKQQQHQSLPRIPSRTTIPPPSQGMFVPTTLAPIKSGKLFQIHEEDGNSPTESTPPPVSVPQFLSPDANFGGFHTVRSEPSFPRMASMMEQVHKTSSDDADIDQPSKRRRTESGVSIMLRPSFDQSPSFSGGMRQKPQRSATMHTATTNSASINVVDLTKNDDDDDVRAFNPNEEEVCYGCVETTLHCTIVPSPKPGARSLFGESWFPIIKIVLKKISGDGTKTIQAYDHTRQIVGRIDDANANILAPLLDSQMKIRTDCRINAQQKAANEVAGQPLNIHKSLQVNLYGPARYSAYIGEVFKRHGMTLRPPQFVQPGIKVMNPHKAVPQPQVRPPIRSYSLTTQPVYQQLGTRSAEEVRDEVMGIFDTLKSNDMPEAEPSDNVVTPLLKHQRQGLYFMQNREREDGPGDAALWPKGIDRKGNSCFRNVLTSDLCRTPPFTRGGILADMMGLGKTLSILSLVASSLSEANEWSMLPPVQPAQPQPQANSKSWMPPKSSFGLTPITRNTRATLLVCPLSTISNWEEQIRAHIKPRGLTYYVYHGANRIKQLDKLADFDIVITTYGSVSSELGARIKGKQGVYPLEELSWFRIVLDEAHMIREQNTLQFKAIIRLQANRRWAVTGTPVQNRLDDLAALLQFIRLRPFDDRGRFNRFIMEPFKLCDPDIVAKLRILVDTVTLRRFKDKINLPKRTDHIVRLDFNDDERYVYQLFSKNAQDRVQALSLSGGKALSGHTYIHILRSILRLRLICAHGRDLLNQEDLRVMQGMSADLVVELDDDEDSIVELSDRKAHDMFELMQQTNNDSCISCSKKLAAEEGTVDESEDDLLGYMNPCFHLICRNCYKPFREAALSSLTGAPRGPCHVCKANSIPALFVELRKSKMNPEHDGAKTAASSNNSSSTALTPAERTRADKASRLAAYRGPSTKVRALLDDLLASKEASTAQAPGEQLFKSVVFSGWTTHLDLIQLALTNAGIRYVRLDGTMTRAARSAAMEAFREDSAIEVILVSIMAGGLGLNLTAGNNVYVMEPQFNPAAEAQAVDRVHRLGQKRPVRTVRYIMRDSFEEKMLELQEKKMKLASLSMDGRDKAVDKGEAALQKLMDIRSLFK